MIGAPAEVVESCRPIGTVHINGELWQARCDAGADAGETVHVEAVDGLMLVVASGGDDLGADGTQRVQAARRARPHVVAPHGGLVPEQSAARRRPGPGRALACSHFTSNSIRSAAGPTGYGAGGPGHDQLERRWSRWGEGDCDHPVHGQGSGALEPGGRIAVALRGDLRGVGFLGTSSSSWAARCSPASSCAGDRRLRDLRLELSRSGFSAGARSCGGGADARPRQRHPRHRVGGAESSCSVRIGVDATSRSRACG